MAYERLKNKNKLKSAESPLIDSRPSIHKTILMKLSKKWTTVTPLSKAVALILFALLPFIGFYLGIRYQKLLLPKVVINTPPIVSPTPTPVNKTSGISDNVSTYTTRSLKFKLPVGWWFDTSTNYWFGDNWTLINPTPVDYSVFSVFKLKAVSGKFEPTFGYQQFLQITKREPITVSGIRGELIIGKATPPTGSEITCPECFLSSYHTGDTVAIALVKEGSNYYSFEGNIDKYEKEFRQILSTFSFVATR